MPDPATLYRWRWMFFVNVGAVPLGIGRAALAEAADIAMTKVSAPTMTPVGQDPTLQANLGRAHALVGSARAYLHDTVGRVWERLAEGSTVSRPLWAEYRLALTTAAHSSKHAVDLVYESLGTTGIYSGSTIGRHHRDLITLAQHVLTQPKTYCSSGRVLLGLEPEALAY